MQGHRLPDGILQEHIKAFQSLYREHCEVSRYPSYDIACHVCGVCEFILSCLQAILDVMVNLQFILVETLWKSFWRFSLSNDPQSLSL